MCKINCFKIDSYFHDCYILLKNYYWCTLQISKIIYIALFSFDSTLTCLFDIITVFTVNNFLSNFKKHLVNYDLLVFVHHAIT